jgi:hypothetical protein
MRGSVGRWQGAGAIAGGARPLPGLVSTQAQPQAQSPSSAGEYRPLCRYKHVKKLPSMVGTLDGQGQVVMCMLVGGVRQGVQPFCCADGQEQAAVIEQIQGANQDEVKRGVWRDLR